jgi:hypothetical protein
MSVEKREQGLGAYLIHPWVRKCSLSSGVRTDVDDMVVMVLRDVIQ